MTVKVLFFGHFSDAYPDQPLLVALAESATVQELARTLAEQDPRLKNITTHCRFAVDEEYASLDQSLQENCVVAVLPPMSGG